jgi:hypothetical protein
MNFLSSENNIIRCFAVDIIIVVLIKFSSFHGTKVKRVIPELCSVLKKFPQLHNLM